LASHPSSLHTTKIRQNNRMRYISPVPCYRPNDFSSRALLNPVAPITASHSSVYYTRLNDMGNLLFCQRMHNLVALSRRVAGIFLEPGPSFGIFHILANTPSIRSKRAPALIGPLQGSTSCILSDFTSQPSYQLRTATLRAVTIEPQLVFSFF
jgi:hypothetical protein